eukprot:15432917-Alexandrium_andersonii.AAC.1
MLSAATDGPLWEMGQAMGTVHPSLQRVLALPESHRTAGVCGKIGRGRTQFETPQLPGEQGPAPVHGNVFVDGSVIRPHPATWVVGAAAAVLNDAPYSELRQTCTDLLEFVFQQQDNEQVFTAPLRGGAISSTRAEALAALIAMSIPSPVHIVSDSLCVVRRIQSWCNNGPPSIDEETVVHHTHLGDARGLRGQFIFMKDGDLWQALAEA